MHLHQVTVRIPIKARHLLFKPIHGTEKCFTKSSPRQHCPHKIYEKGGGNTE